MRITTIGIFTIALISAAAAAEKPVQLKPGAGLDKVEANCAACHSLDYIVMNSPFLTAPGWEAVVNKMVKAFGAPIEAPEAKAIAEYLKRYYGADADAMSGSGANAPSARRPEGVGRTAAPSAVRK
jgi:sulfite dehydrogenase (cytochrome) subunit B